MKPFLLNFKDHDGKVIKTYSVCSLKTGMFTKLIPIVNRAKAFEENNDYQVSEIDEFINETAAFIVDAFGRQFTLDELLLGVEIGDLLKAIGELFNAIDIKNPAGGTAKR